MPPAPKTWKEFAGREHGPNGYRFGDIARHYWSFFRGSGQQQQLSNAVNDNDKAMLDLKVQIDALRWHQRSLQAKMGEEEKAARQLIQAGRKDRAMIALRGKKQHAKLVDDCDGHIAKLEELIDNIEMADMQKEIVAALTSGVSSLKRIQKSIGSADQVQQLLEDCEDAQAAQQELAEALAQSGIAEDDPEALAELERIRAAQVQEALQAAQTSPVDVASQGEPQKVAGEMPAAEEPEGRAAIETAVEVPEGTDPQQQVVDKAFEDASPPEKRALCAQPIPA
mmetsp:Transcript_35633/g.81681  ORF Transcript_35633/g.81681 Transcript_35633/m.81681 type:complete len:282 (-) Transcript_35633:77-922(-)